jgi:uncharacterized membrane protein YgcG
LWSDGGDSVDAAACCVVVCVKDFDRVAHKMTFPHRARTAEAARVRVEAVLAEHRHLNDSRGGTSSRNRVGGGSSRGSGGGSVASVAAADPSAVDALRAAMAAMDEALLQT